jgi:hypothetical protein
VSWDELVMSRAVGTSAAYLARIVPAAGQAIASGLLELELGTIGRGKFVDQRIELQGASNGHCDDEVGRSDEGVSGRVGVVAASEVTYVKSCQLCVRDSEVRNGTYGCTTR